jgi:hypothetical protein
MLIAFANTGTNPDIDIFLKSVEGNDLWQLTDDDTPELPGCNVFRFPRGDEPFMLWRAKVYAAFNRPGLYCDTDLIIQRDLSPIMALEFDVAFTKTWVAVKDPDGTNLTELMPYNGGVVFVKHPEFWPHVVELMDTMHPDHKEWYGDQLALAHLAKQYYTVELPSKIYNYTPMVKEHETHADLSDKWILHFKGKRKEWMRDYGNHNLRNT